MLLRALLCTAAFTALALGCTATEPGPSSPPAPGEGTQGDDLGQPASTTKGCTSGATSNAEGGFCVALPQGSTTTPTQKAASQYEYATANGAVTITVRTGDQAAFEAAKSQLAAKATSFGGHSRGNDIQFSGVWREANPGPRSTATMLFDGGKIYECHVSSTNAPTLMACQSLRAL